MQCNVGPVYAAVSAADGKQDMHNVTPMSWFSTICAACSIQDASCARPIKTVTFVFDWAARELS
jgi:hypothetical protein